MVKQVILFRKDLHMRKGKIAAQVAHASLKVFLDRRDQKQRTRLEVDLTKEMQIWVNGMFTKIVLSVESEEDLLEAAKQAQKANLPYALVRDNGRTEFNGVKTYTTLAIGPAKAELIDPITGRKGLIKTSLA